MKAFLGENLSYIINEQIQKAQLHFLWSYVKDAREACAGEPASIKPKAEVLKKIDTALEYCEMLRIPKDNSIVVKLKRAYELMEETRSYGSRLPVDDLLCGILSKELRNC